MDAVSRRRFLATTGVAAGTVLVAGKATAAEAASVPAAASSVGLDEAVLQHQAPAAGEHIMLFVSDPVHGDVTVMSGAHEVVYNDPMLVARIQRVIRRAQV